MSKNRLDYFRKYREKNRNKLRKYNRVYNRLWRKENGYYNEENSAKKYPERVYARQLTQVAIRNGKIIATPCEVCGKTKVQAHHDNYDKPFEVRFLCPVHHKVIHTELLTKKTRGI